MIKQLRKKVLVTIMCFVTLIIAAFLIVINAVPVQRDRQEAREYLARMSEIGGGRPQLSPLPAGGAPDAPPNERGGGNMFSMANAVTVRLSADGSVLSWDGDREESFSLEYLTAFAGDVLASGKEFGVRDGQYYLLRSAGTQRLLLLLDNGIGFASARRNLLLSLAAGAAAWVLLLTLSVFLVNRMTGPVAEAFERQRQFIADAGHELKTPIAVIAANANVLESESGGSKWLSYIRTETQRMDGLVKDLTALAAMDASEGKGELAELDLSSAVLSAALPFESLAFERGMTLSLEVADGVRCRGNEERLMQLVTILLSNALKYGEDGGEIKVTLRQDHRRALLQVYNTGQGIRPEELERIFDRFYRADKARSRASGSYGLGLAIAKAIVTEHGGRISAASEPGKWARFDVLLNT